MAKLWLVKKMHIFAYSNQYTKNCGYCSFTTQKKNMRNFRMGSVQQKLKSHTVFN